MLTVVCVLKSGGDFDEDYVFALREGVEKNLDIPHEFVCYTDTKIKGVRIRFLTENLEGWFSKFEVFREHGPVLYLDLDTVVTGELGSLAQDVCSSPDTFWMLEAFNVRRKWASGIMAWTGDWLWLTLHCKRYSGLYDMDQDCIAKALGDKRREARVIERRRYGIYSYKHHCREELPDDAKIVCFHGKPRPKEVEESWVKV